MQNLNKLAADIHEAAKEKGFWDEPRELGTLLMLATSELSECLEADRKSKYANLNNLYKSRAYEKKSFVLSFENHIKDTVEDELADALIRILDIAASRGIDIQEHVELKLQYNSSRPSKHGKNY